MRRGQRLLLVATADVYQHLHQPVRALGAQAVTASPLKARSDMRHAA